MLGQQLFGISTSKYRIVYLKDRQTFGIGERSRTMIGKVHTAGLKPPI